MSLVGVLTLNSLGGRAGLFSSDGTGTRGPSVLRLPAGVRAMGLGGNYVAVADDTSATQWNPAGLQQLPEKEIQFMRSELFAGQNLQYMGYAHPHWRQRDRETWGVSATLLDVKPFDVREEGQPLGSARPMEGAAGLSYSRFFRNISWGITGKFVEAKTYQQQGQTYAMDLGVMGRSPTQSWTWGASVSNLGPPLRLGSQSLGLPTVFRAGTSWRKRGGGPRALLATGQIDFPLDEAIGGGLGIEYRVPLSLGWRAALRGGFHRAGTNRYSVGFGIGRGSLGINYAFTSLGDVGDAGSLDLSFRFGGPLTQEVERTQWVEEGQRALADGDVAHAREVWERLNERSPAYGPTQRLGRAIQERVVESLDPGTIFIQGKEAYDKKQYIKAADQFRKLLLVAPEYPEGQTWLNKTEMSIESDRMARLKAEITAAREREYRHLVRQAESYGTQKRWEEALSVWKRANTLQVDTATVARRIRNCQENLYGQAEEALLNGNKVKARDLFLSAESAGTFKDAARRAKKIDQQLVQEHLADAQGKYREGRDAYVKGDLSGARRLFESALALDPENKGIRQALNQVLEELKLSPVNRP